MQSQHEETEHRYHKFSVRADPREKNNKERRHEEGKREKKEREGERTNSKKFFKTK